MAIGQTHRLPGIVGRRCSPPFLFGNGQDGRPTILYRERNAEDAQASKEEAPLALTFLIYVNWQTKSPVIPDTVVPVRDSGLPLPAKRVVPLADFAPDRESVLRT